MDELQQQYNHLIKRYKNACAYLDSEERTKEELEKYTPEYRKILSSLNELIEEIEKEQEMSREQILEGF